MSIKDELKEMELIKFGVDVPAWIDQDVTLGQAMETAYHGCESGTYMPAVTYHIALQTMEEYGDDVLDYLNDVGADLVMDVTSESWAGIACKILSTAVEIWCGQIDDEEYDLYERYWEYLQERCRLEVIDDYGFPGNLYLINDALVCADSECSAWEAWVDEQATIEPSEIFEAYGYNTEEEYQKAMEEENVKELAEGYDYQSNASGTGIVFVGYYVNMKETTLKAVEEEFCK